MHTTLLPNLATVKVSGDDRATFLHGQLSNDINNLATNQACYATYNTPKGRVIANMLVLNRGNDLILILPKDLVDKTIGRLKMFVLRAKVVFEPLNNFSIAAELPQQASPIIAESPTHHFPAQENDQVWRITLPHQGILLVGPSTSLPNTQDETLHQWQQHEILSGYPWITAATSETAVAQMLNQHIIGSVHFKKGCYPGQEIIARAQYRGQVKRGLAIFETDGSISVGETLLLNTEDVGTIINTAPANGHTLVLAVIKHAAAHSPLTTEKGTLLNPQSILFHSEPA